MNTLKNYIGQLRLYSLADLTLLLIAARASTSGLLGALLLWLGFLALLEARHAHPYRNKIPQAVCVPLFIFGWILYGGYLPAGYILLSYLYTLKQGRLWGILSPLLRAAQTFLIVAGVAGLSAPLIYIAPLMIGIRNILGDVRDIAKDRNNGMRTIPITLGLRNQHPNIHLYGTILTSVAWWYFGSLPLSYLILVILIIVGSYRMTPR